MVKSKRKLFLFQTKKKIFFIYKIIRVAELAQTIEFEYKPTLEELLSTVINREDVEELVKRPVNFISLVNIYIYNIKNQIGSSIFW